MADVLKGFRTFLLRGNVVDLAVAVVIGAAFGALVTSLVTNVFTPLIAAVIGQPDFGFLTISVGDGEIRYGLFLDALIAFVSIAAAVYFLVVVPVNALAERRRTGREVESETRACPECLSDIPTGARRCAFCTASVAPAA